ncbi:GtrA family protein [Neobacillus sp. M.A.Huq-85]
MKREILLFLIIGVINTLVGLSSVYFIFNIIGLSYWPSTFLGNGIGIGMLVSYTLNKKFTFQSKEKEVKSFLKFITVVISCYYGSYGLSNYVSKLILSSFINEPKMIGNLSILIGAGLYTITNFFGQKYIVFYKSNSKKSGEFEIH